MNKNKKIEKTVHSDLGIWTFVKAPKKGEFVLVATSPFIDFFKELGTEKKLEELVKMGERNRARFYSSLRIYNDKKLIVWDAFLPTTFPPSDEEYDPQYLKELKEQEK